MRGYFNKTLVPKSGEIINKVGGVKFVAPTKGPNIDYSEGGSSHPSSNFTLEVVGETGTGFAYITTWGAA